MNFRELPGILGTCNVLGAELIVIVGLKNNFFAMVFLCSLCDEHKGNNTLLLLCHPKGHKLYSNPKTSLAPHAHQTQIMIARTRQTTATMTSPTHNT